MKKAVSLAKKRREEYELIQPVKKSSLSLRGGTRALSLRPYEPPSFDVPFSTGYVQVLAYRVTEVSQHGVDQPRFCVEMASSFCSPKDEFDALAGRESAIGRLDQKQRIIVDLRFSDLEEGTARLLFEWWDAMRKLPREERVRLGVPDPLYAYLIKVRKEMRG